MTMRSDGRLGFPGGLVEPGETPVEAAARESLEEVNAGSHLRIEDSELLCAHLMRRHEDVGDVELYFYAREISLDDFKRLERSALEAEHYGKETLGVFRVPLYKVNGASSKGLPDFLRNAFAGNSREQLMFGLYSTNLLSLEEAKTAMDMAGDKAR